MPSKHSIEGTIVFMRGDPETQACICCPPKEGHIFSRRVEWDKWQTRRSENSGYGPDALLAEVLDFNQNEGKRVRVTIELL